MPKRAQRRWRRCDPGCPGWFQNTETGIVEACDACGRFRTDDGVSSDDLALDHVVRLAEAAERGRITRLRRAHA